MGLTFRQIIIDCMMEEKLLDVLTEFKWFQELLDSIAENRDFDYSKDGLIVSAKSSDNGIQLTISYEEPENLAETEAEDFKNYIETLDDELFIEVCESLGSDQLARITNCVKSEDVETVRAGVLRFKQELKKVLVNKIEFYQECLDNLTM